MASQCQGKHTPCVECALHAGGHVREVLTQLAESCSPCTDAGTRVITWYDRSNAPRPPTSVGAVLGERGKIRLHACRHNDHSRTACCSPPVATSYSAASVLRVSERTEAHSLSVCSGTHRTEGATHNQCQMSCELTLCTAVVRNVCDTHCHVQPQNTKYFTQTPNQ